MARTIASDFYQSFRYVVSISTPGQEYIEAQAGFQNITTPEVSIESAEYRDGQTIWTRKYPGVPTVSDSTLQQGVAAIGTDPGSVAHGSPFLDWILAAIEGRQFRSELNYWHVHIADGFPPTDASASRVITLHEAFPMRVKPDGDFDSTSSEISLREMDVSCEKITVSVAVPGTGASPS